MKTFTITVDDNGGCTVADEGGKEVGAFASAEELSAGIGDILGSSGEAVEPEGEAESVAPEAEGAPETEDEATEPQDGETNYAKKKGMRPKMQADLADYFGAPGSK
jgi:hypothetical protein